ncbi:MAG TPA: VOC family protein [Candidatus Dormibacteraeota bacterium]|nr:VOC family protein [Candidatus Dormibacteraeota bacterium]
MTLEASSIVIGVADLDRARKFYAEGLGCPIVKDFPQFVSFRVGDGGSELGLYTWEALAQDAGVAATHEDGFRGVSFHDIVDTKKEVDEIMAKAEHAGAKIVRKAEASRWGGYFGWFADPDGHLWKVATSEQ